MGGYGSGRWYRWNSKKTAESQYRIDIRWMKKQQYLRPGKVGVLAWECGGKDTGSISFRMEHDRIILNYQNREKGGDWENIEDEIFFTWTPCNYGGRRPWLICPGCGRRVAVLYGGKYYRCRHCRNLNYTSQHENKPDRLMRKARKIRKRLGASSNFFVHIHRKPKNMHYKTYERLKRDADWARYQSLMITAEREGIRVPR